MVEIVRNSCPPLAEDAFSEFFQENAGMHITTEGIRSGMKKTQHVFSKEADTRLMESKFYSRKEEKLGDAQRYRSGSMDRYR